MPHQRVLQVLNMTPADWGQATLQGKRDGLLAKAKQLIEAENAAARGTSVPGRLDDLEARVHKLEAQMPHRPQGK